MLCQAPKPSEGPEMGQEESEVGQRASGPRPPASLSCQMHTPGVGPQLCHFTWAKIAPAGTWGADGYQGRQCGQGAGELKSTEPLVADLLALGRSPRTGHREPSGLCGLQETGLSEPQFCILKRGRLHLPPEADIRANE